MVTRELVQVLLRQFALARDGEHGVAHWARVFENGLLLASVTGARRSVVELFAIFHDSRRLSDGDDPLHGRRAADYAAELRGWYFDLSDADFALLSIACTYHTDGRTDGDITVQTCWDADRLDLGRGGITPDPSHLCTPPARQPELIAWATRRAQHDEVPLLVSHSWDALPISIDPQHVFGA
jgi:uncharacterized protein